MPRYWNKSSRNNVLSGTFSEKNNTTPMWKIIGNLSLPDKSVASVPPGCEQLSLRSRIERRQ